MIRKKKKNRENVTEKEMYVYWIINMKNEEKKKY